MLRSLRCFLLRAGVAVVPSILLASCTANPSPPASASAVVSQPYASPWWLRSDQLGAQSTAGTFAIKAVEVINMDLHAYYAMRSLTPGPPQATATSTFASCQPASASGQVGPAAVQSFGPLGDSDVGVIHVPIVDQPGQVVTLEITPPGAAAPSWTLAFLEQIAPIGHPQGLEGLGIDQEAVLPEVQIATMLGYDQGGHSGYFALAQPGTPPSYLPSVFFVMASDGTVEQISRAAFMSGTSGQVAAGGTYVPRPTYQPTSTPISTVMQTPTLPYVRCNLQQ